MESRYIGSGYFSKNPQADILALKY